MSDSVRPHPWDSPGKNTGVGCHFLLQCIKVKSESEDTQSCLTLCNPMDCSPPGSSVHGIFQARVLEWAAIAFFKFNYMPRKRQLRKKECFQLEASEYVFLLSPNSESCSQAVQPVKPVRFSCFHSLHLMEPQFRHL